MSSLFSLDSKFMQAMNRIADLLILNLLFLLTCLPVFTIGAASTALYTVCFRFDTDREQGIFRSYFLAFRNNFQQASTLWLILLLCLSAAFYNMLLFYVMPGAVRHLFILFALLLAVTLFVIGYTFPLLSQFENSTGKTLKNALILSLGYAPRTLVIACINVLPFFLALTQLQLFFHMAFFWFTLYFSAAAYLNSILLKKVFAPFLEPETDKMKED